MSTEDLEELNTQPLQVRASMGNSLSLKCQHRRPSRYTKLLKSDERDPTLLKYKTAQLQCITFHPSRTSASSERIPGKFRSYEVENYNLCATKGAQNRSNRQLDRTWQNKNINRLFVKPR